LNRFLFILLVLFAFGLSTYVSFTLFIRGRSVSTPNLVGKGLDEAKAICSDLGIKLTVDPRQRNADKIAAGSVAWQNRTPGTTSLIKRGTEIHVELSAGPLVLRVPNLEGQSPRVSLLILGRENLKLDNLTYVDGGGRQTVAGEDPPKDTVVAAQQPVSLLISTPVPPPTYVMPDLIDERLDVVRPALDQRGLTISTVKFEAYPGIADGTIIRQFPLRGAPVSGRDPITVVVSKQEEGGIIEPPPPTTTQ
jgi:beta-lactam-binding protein with PASTA domain